MSKKKSRCGKIRPYKVVKHEYIEVTDPLGGIVRLSTRDPIDPSTAFAITGNDTDP